MGSITKYRKSQWLTKEDVLALSPAQRRTRILNITEEEVGDDMRYVANLAGISKGWPLNQTALIELEAMTGHSDTDDFAGTAVEIYVDPAVTYQGKRVGGIKLRAPAPAPRPTRTPAAAPPAEAFDSDDWTADVPEAV